MLAAHAQAIGIEVEDATHAYEQCLSHGGVGVQLPTEVADKEGRGVATISEVHAYGDVVLRFISFGGVTTGAGAGDESVTDGAFSGAFLPNFVDVASDGARQDFGLQRADHIVGNVWDMLESVRLIMYTPAYSFYFFLHNPEKIRVLLYDETLLS